MHLLNRTCYPQITGQSRDQITDYQEKVLQFGEGNFLRGFVDWMFDKLIEKDLFHGHITVVQPIKFGLIPKLNEQDGLYTLLLRGISDGEIKEEKKIITSIKRGINPYTEFEEYLNCAKNPNLRYIISNTTEAGITFSGTDKPTDMPPASFPGKLTVLLYNRYQAFQGATDKGLVIIPCELIEKNGATLKRIVLRLAAEWGYEKGFTDWLENANYFLNTLVDRIVTGHPRNEIAALTEETGYRDNLFDTAEYFHLWVIEGDKKLRDELPFDKAGLNVIWTDDMTPYRTRKVRILNGAHTMTVLAAYLYGLNTVKECTGNDVIMKFMKKGIFNEIIPTLDLPENELFSFADSVLERFANPFVEHFLLSISLNSVSKFRVRVLPSLLQYFEQNKKLPEILSFSLAALIQFYKGNEIEDNTLIGTRNGNIYKIQDDMDCLAYFLKVWKKCNGSLESFMALTKSVLSQESFWGLDLSTIPGLVNVVSGYLHDIHHDGMEKVLTDLISDESRWNNERTHSKNQWAG